MSSERPPMARSTRHRRDAVAKAPSPHSEVEDAANVRRRRPRTRPVADDREVICDLPDPLPITVRELDVLEAQLGALIDGILYE